MKIVVFRVPSTAGWWGPNGLVYSNGNIYVITVPEYTMW